MMKPRLTRVAVDDGHEALPVFGPAEEGAGPWWCRGPFRSVLPGKVRSRLWYRDMDRQIREAARLRDFDHVHELREDVHFAQQEDEEEDARNETRRLLAIAGRLHVQTPPLWREAANREQSPYWTSRHEGAPLYLTPRGMEWVRARIRRELRWRQQQRLHLVTVVGTLLGAVTGLLAAAVALASVMYR